MPETLLLKRPCIQLVPVVLLVKFELTPNFSMAGFSILVPTEFNTACTKLKKKIITFGKYTGYPKKVNKC